jgi:hypothetical protein
MITPVYETTEITKGFNTKIGVAYQRGQYTSDSLDYEYNFARVDVPVEYGINNWSSVLICPYVGLGKGKVRYYALVEDFPPLYWNTVVRKNYVGSYLSLKLSPFSNWRVAPAVVMGANFGLYVSIDRGYDDQDWLRFVEYFPVQLYFLMGIKDSGKRERITLGVGDCGALSPSTVFLVYKPRIRQDNIRLFFGIGLYPLGIGEVERAERELLHIRDMAAGIACTLN